MEKKIIFIGGSGRSGTHLIGRTVGSHKMIDPRIEVKSTFNLITKIATHQDYWNSVYLYLHKKLLRVKLERVLNNSNTHVLEKSHPSLWLAEFLLNSFQNSYFIFVYRDLEPTVSSMLDHKGIMRWYLKLPLNKENRFLGITTSNCEKFAQFTAEEKCACRWLTHRNEIFRLNKMFPEKTIIIKYDDFMISPHSKLEEISKFLRLTNSFITEPINIASLNKWKGKLTQDQIDRMNKIIEEDVHLAEDAEAGGVFVRK